ncbi:MAG: C4-type zinc ribbon domain-containing protein [Sporichthyaceae bacterium]|nr:C4-type zinc ribbon domain-containing protein [Sporichthyaceae bacterium]
MDRPRAAREEDPALNALTAAADDQLRLLEVQRIDSRLDQLDYRKQRLPEHEQIQRGTTRMAELRTLLVAAQTEQTDIEREQRKAEADVDAVRARAVRDRERLDRGQVGSPRELESLQHEIETLQRRQSDLEDVVLEIMERSESCAARLAELTAEQDRLGAELAAAESRRDAQTAELDAEAGGLSEQRKSVVAELPTELVTLYERIRAQQGGVGAAPLRQRRCDGCRLEIGATDLQRFRTAPPDAVLRCEECRRILIRVPDSGL